MATTSLVILICVILLIAYVFDLTSDKTKIPSVILLLILGWLLRQGVSMFLDVTPDLRKFLPAFGTIGLILIVLEGTMDLEITKKEVPTIRKSFLISFISSVTMLGILSYVFMVLYDTDFRKAMVNAVPFCIVSSSIAISSVKNWNRSWKALVTYESTLSDIFGVMIFNFLILNSDFTTSTFLWFSIEILLFGLVSIIASFLISYLISKSQHHIKYGPILIMVILTYYLTKLFHLPGLIFIALFGLLLGNFNKLGSLNPFVSINSHALTKDVNSFKEIVKEATFLIRSLFFILFGYTIEFTELVDNTSLMLAAIIIISILILRIVILTLLKLNRSPVLFIFPRGLITILLFYSIPENLKISDVNNSLILQVILMSIMLMLLGEFFNAKRMGSNSTIG